MYRNTFNNTEKVNIYTFPDDDDHHSPFTVKALGHSICNKDFIIDSPNRSLHVIGYVQYGSGCLKTPYGKDTMMAGNVFIIPENIPHYYHTYDCDEWSFHWFNVKGAFFLELLSAYNLINRYILKNCDIGDRFVNALDFAFSNVPFQDKKITLNEKLFGILQKISDTSHGITLSQPTETIKNYIDNRIYDKLSLDTLSSVFNFSKHQIYRLFHKELNCSPYNYILNRKISIAQNLLVNTTLSVKEISYMLSFSDPYYFSSIFKKKTGLSPMNFIKKQKLI